MRNSQKWAIGLAATLSVAGMVATGVMAAAMVLGMLHAVRDFAHVFNGALSW